MMERCALVYNDTQPYLPWEKISVIDNKESGVYAVIRVAGSSLIITFRGSDSTRDWVTNFSLIKKCVPYDNFSSKIRIHSGFIDAYKSVREKIQSYINDDIIFVYVCGHSLGAALALVCAVDIQYNFPQKDIETYVFGCPRVGNLPFVQSYNKRVIKTFRINTKGDVITKLPPSWLGYRHAGMGYKIPAVQYNNPHMPSIYLQSIIKDFEFSKETKALPILR